MFLSSFLSCDGWWHYVIYFEKLWRLLSSMDFLNMFIFKFKRNCVLSNSKFEMIFFSIIIFLKPVHIEQLCFVTFVLLIWCYHGECNSFKIFFLWFWVNLANEKVGWMFVEHNDVSRMGENWRKSSMNIIFTSQIGKMLIWFFVISKAV